MAVRLAGRLLGPGGARDESNGANDRGTAHAPDFGGGGGAADRVAALHGRDRRGERLAQAPRDQRGEAVAHGTWEHAKDGRAATIAWSPNGRAVFCPSSRPTGKVWDAATGTLLRTIPGVKGEIYSAAFSADSRWLALGWTDGQAKVVDWQTGAEVATLAGHIGGADHVEPLGAAGDAAGRWTRTGRLLHVSPAR